jgi:hypothetical protein
MLKPNERGLWKTLGICGKQVYVLIKLSNNLEYDLINCKVHGCIVHVSVGGVFTLMSMVWSTGGGLLALYFILACFSQINYLTLPALLFAKKVS